MDQVCECESYEHFDLQQDETVAMGLPYPQNRTSHVFHGVPAGTQTAAYVGHVCDECAATHMKDFIL